MPKGVRAIRQGDRDGDRREIARSRRQRDDPPPLEPRGEGKNVLAGQWSANFKTGLPNEKGCEFPLECLGVVNGTYYLLDSSGMFRGETASFFTHAGLQDIFGAVPNYPQWACPRFGRAKKGEKPKIESFKDDEIRTLIFRACRRARPFTPEEALRGRGAWKLAGGQLLYHAGEELWVCEGDRLIALETGLYEDYLYPRLPDLPAPWGEPFGPDDNPAGTLLETFRKWNWDRPAVDPILLLGWIGVAYLGGALDWRSAVFLIGGFGTGKSTLQEGLKAIFGHALFQSADTTAAGIYQKISHDSRPVAIDELESDADSRKVTAVVRLARAASSGAMGQRGGSDGTGSEFQMRSAFLFSAINNPLQSAQDLSRVAILRLRTLDPEQPRPPAIDTETTGRMILAQLMRNWHRWEQTLGDYKQALGAGGHTARGQATYGALIAAADLMLGPELAARLEVETVDLGWWTKNLSADSLPEIEDAKQNWRACIEHLLTARVEVWRNGVRSTVGKLLDDVETGAMPDTDAIRDLAMTGLGLILPGKLIDRGYGYLLAVPNQSQMVAELFRGTQWAGVPGGGGPWKDALRQAQEHNIVITDRDQNRIRINGTQTRCTLIIMKNFHAAPER